MEGSSLCFKLKSIDMGILNISRESIFMCLLLLGFEGVAWPCNRGVQLFVLGVVFDLCGTGVKMPSLIQSSVQCDNWGCNNGS